MKTNTYNLIKTVGIFAFSLMVFVAGTNSVFAATLNNDSSDFATLRVSNYSDNPGCSTCWSNSVSADAGEIVSFSLYYHNTSNETAQNVRVRLTPQNTSSGNSHTFNAYVWADNASQVYGSATVHLSSEQSLSYNGSSFWYPNQTAAATSLPNGQSGYDIFSTNGVSLGDIAPGWSTQGSIVVRFQVSNNNTQQGQRATVTTYSAKNIGRSDATLSCYVNPNNTTDTMRWFEYGTSQSFGHTTVHESQGSSSGNFDTYINGLQENATYYYRCVAQNSYGTTYGDTLNFYTNGYQQEQIPTVTTYANGGSGQSFGILKGYVNPNNTTNTTRWFEWGLHSWALDNSTVKLSQGSSSGTFSETISGLQQNTSYYYRAVARNDYGTVYGGIQSFTTTNSNPGNYQKPYVSTYGATDVQTSSATFNGYVNPYAQSNTTRWFEYGTSNSLGYSTNKMSQGTSASNFSDRVNGLLNNTTYYYRAVSQNGYGISYGNILSFTTRSTHVSNQAPEAVTNLATNIGYRSARLNGLAIVHGNAHTAGWIEWGTNSALRNKSDVQNLGTAPTMNFKYSLFSLSPNTTYYYRAVVQNSNGTGYGDIRTFKTNSEVIVPVVSGSKKVRDVSIEKRVENIVSQNGTDQRVEALRGDVVRFTITVENTGDYTLENVKIKDRIPHYLEFANAEDENVDSLQREVVWIVGELKSGEKEEVSIDMIVTGDAKIGSVIENVAQVETKRITRSSKEVSIEVVKKLSSSLAAGVLFGGGFLPDTLIEWLILVVLIFALIVLSRTLYGYYDESKKKKMQMLG